MKHLSFVAVVIAAAAVAVAADPPKRQPQEGKLKVGDAAPNFAVQDVAGKKTIKLSQLQGKPVVLIFGSCT